MELSEVKRAVKKQSRVMYNGHEYIFHASRIFKRLHEGRVDYSAELLDKNKNSVIYADLEKVELIGGQDE